MEIELKLAIDSRHLQRLKRHPLLVAAAPAARDLLSVYHDTPAFDLMRRGIAYRLRRVGYHWVQTVKAEAASVGALTSRPEWELPVAGNAPDFAVLPADALALFDGIEPARIAPVFATEFRRQTWLIERDGAAMEVALDVGHIQAGEHTAPIQEVEVELKSGAPEALFDLALALLEAVPMHLEPRSKAARGYALAGAIRPAPVKAMHPVLAPGQAAGAAWRALAEAALAQAAANVPGFMARPEEIEYLHQLRVALRRLRVVARLRTGLGLPRPAWDASLRELMGRLNPARDWDVLLAETLPGVRAACAGDPLDEALLAALRQAGDAARAAARAAIADPGFTRLVLEIGRDLIAAPDADLDAGAWARGVLDKRWKALRGKARGLERQTPAERHAARIAAKRLRYAADAFAGLYPHAGGRFLTRLAALQDGLGQANDVAVAARLLRGLDLDGAARFDAGRVAGMLAMAAHGEQVARQWRALVKARPFWR